MQLILSLSKYREKVNEISVGSAEQTRVFVSLSCPHFDSAHAAKEMGVSYPKRSYPILLFLLDERQVSAWDFVCATASFFSPSFFSPISFFFLLNSPQKYPKRLLLIAMGHA